MVGSNGYAGKVDAGGGGLAGIVFAVPGELVDAASYEVINGGADATSEDVVDDDGQMIGGWYVEFDSGAGVEGVGESSCHRERAFGVDRDGVVINTNAGNKSALCAKPPFKTARCVPITSVRHKFCASDEWEPAGVYLKIFRAAKAGSEV